MSSTSVGAFSVELPGDATRHYERDVDLTVGVKGASRGGQVAGVVLVELGIDGNDMHMARLNFNWVDGASEDAAVFHYALPSGDDEVRALTDAIECLTVLRDQLARMTDRSD